MKTTTLLMMGAGLVLTSVSGWAEPTAASELERGVELMETETGVGKAIPHFEEVIRRDKESSRLAAEAWYHLAKCHLAQGDKAAALRCVAKLGAGWPADNEWVIRAGKLLPVRPGVFREAPWASGEFLIYGAKVEHEGETLDAGKFASLLASSGEAGERIWTAWSFSESDLCTYRFKETDYRPVSGWFDSMLQGNQTLTTGSTGGIVLRRKGMDQPIVTFPPGGNGGVPVYHFMQVHDLVRVLDLAPGKSATLPVISQRNPAEKVPCTITATELSKIETPAGVFDCLGYKVTSDQDPAGVTYWVESEGSRKIVKLELGPMTATLLSAREGWKADESVRFPEAAKPGAISFTVPRGLIAFDDTDQSAPYALAGGVRVRFYDTELRVRSGFLERVPVGPSELNALKEKGLSPDAAQAMLKDLEKPGTLVEEIADGRKLSNAGGKFSLTTRFKIERGEQKVECTARLFLGKDAVIMGCIEHEKGAGEAAAKLLDEIQSSL